MDRSSTALSGECPRRRQGRKSDALRLHRGLKRRKKIQRRLPTERSQEEETLSICERERRKPEEADDLSGRCHQIERIVPGSASAARTKERQRPRRRQRRKGAFGHGGIVSRNGRERQAKISRRGEQLTLHLCCIPLGCERTVSRVGFGVTPKRSSGRLPGTSLKRDGKMAGRQLEGYGDAGRRQNRSRSRRRQGSAESGERQSKRPRC